MKRSWNPRLWLGFALVLVGVVSFPTFLIRFPVTRDFPWPNLLLLGLAAFLLITGVRRAFRQPEAYRGKVSGPILASLGFLLAGFFLVEIFYVARQVPESRGAPSVGAIAPDFTLVDSSGRLVTLSALLSSPFVPDGSSSPGNASGQTAGVVLIFYRGYW
ncbi:MAG: hypothetical protein WBP79_04915 [Candidatus Acidiferrales bacterium]